MTLRPVGVRPVSVHALAVCVSSATSLLLNTEISLSLARSQCGGRRTTSLSKRCGMARLRTSLHSSATSSASLPEPEAVESISFVSRHDGSRKQPCGMARKVGEQVPVLCLSRYRTGGASLQARCPLRRGCSHVVARAEFC